MAARAGVDAIGMVFYPKARRCISIDTAREIVWALPPFVTPVGLFVDQEIEEIRRIAGELRLRTIQLHGHEPPETVAALRDFAVLKAIRAAKDTLAAELDLWRETMAALDLHNLRGFVLETPSGGPGGTGIENDWETIADLQRRGAFDGLPPIIAAGGLRPDNVARVVELIQPYAVDVSSGVEETYGEKSEELVEAFVANSLSPGGRGMGGE